MALHKIKDFYPDYRDQFGDHDILSYSFYSDSEKIGSIEDLLVDEEGRFRYLVVNTGAWIFGKKVLLPIGQARIDYNNRRIYASGLNREQVENLPEYDPDSAMDYDYEERVRNVYRPATSSPTRGTATTGLETSATVDNPASLDATPGIGDRSHRNYDRNNYRYDYDPNLYDLGNQDHQTLRLYEERLVTNKSRQKVGEVTVGKRVETDTQHVSVPVERERVVIERVEPTQRDVDPALGSTAFQEGEAVRMEIYEEVPEIRKEAVVREEVRVRKEVDRDTAESDETIRRERLDIDKNGNPITRDQDGNPLTRD